MKPKTPPMKQKVYIDIHLYDENMRTIFKNNHSLAEKAMKDAEHIINKKIRN